MESLPYIYTNKQTQAMNNAQTPRYTEADRIAEIQAMPTRDLGEIVAKCPIGHETWNRAIEELKRRGY